VLVLCLCLVLARGGDLLSLELLKLLLQKLVLGALLLEILHGFEVLSLLVDQLEVMRVGRRGEGGTGRERGTEGEGNKHFDE
jgi:hypothetical protein